MSNENPSETSRPEDTFGALSPDIGRKAKDELGGVVDTARSELDAVKQRAVDDVGQLKDQAKTQIDAATGKAKSFAGEQKDFAAGQLSGIATALEKVANELDSDQGTLATYTRDLARGLEKMSGTVKNREVDDLIGMAQDFGRSQPIAFLGAAVLAGFMASRFALSSAHRREAGVPMPKPFAGDQSNNYRPETSAAYPATQEVKNGR